MVRSLFAAIVLLAAWPVQAAHIVVTTSPADPEHGIFVIAGDLLFGDADEFRSKAEGYSRGTVVLQSGGGNLHAGVTIGKTIREKRFSTGVGEGSFCASACALAWLGGTPRSMARSAQIGFHAASRSDGTETGQGNAYAGAYLARLGLSDEAILYIAGASPKEMAWLDPAAAGRLGIEMEFPRDVAASRSRERDPAESLPSPSLRQTFLDVGFLKPWERLSIRRGPDEGYPSFHLLPNGTRVELLRSERDWRLVKLPNGETGWAHSKYLLCCETVVAGPPRPDSDPQTTGSLRSLYRGRPSPGYAAGSRTARSISGKVLTRASPGSRKCPRARGSPSWASMASGAS